MGFISFFSSYWLKARVSFSFYASPFTFTSTIGRDKERETERRDKFKKRKERKKVMGAEKRTTTTSRLSRPCHCSDGLCCSRSGGRAKKHHQNTGAVTLPSGYRRKRCLIRVSYKLRYGARRRMRGSSLLTATREGAKPAGKIERSHYLFVLLFVLLSFYIFLTLFIFVSSKYAF